MILAAYAATAPTQHILESQLPLDRPACFLLGVVLGICLCLWMKK